MAPHKLIKKEVRIMIESEDGTVTGSIDVARLSEIEPKTDEARAQLDALKAEAQAGQEQAEADAEKVAAQAYAQSAEGQREAQEETTTEAVPPWDAEPAGDDAGAAGAEDADEVDRLRAEAESLGVKVDKRWGADRLRQEIDAAQAG